MDNRQEAQRRKFAITIALIIGALMLVVKVSAYLMTSSSAILADALESIVHVAATGIAFYSVLLSLKPPDKSHPYGHGKVEFFSAGLEGSLIIIAAIVIMFESVRAIIVGRELHNLDTGVMIIAGSGIVNVLLGIYLIRTGKKTDSIAIVADGKHVLTDSATSFGVVLGLTVVYLTGWEILDPLVAVIVALNILYSGGKLVRQSVGGLMHESDEQVLEALVSRLNKRREKPWIDIHQLRTWKSGDKNYIDFHLTIPYYWNVERAHTEQLNVDHALKDLLDGKAEVLIHLDPCKPSCCSFCEVENCSVRKYRFNGKKRWTVEHAVSPPQYLSTSETERE